MQNLKPLSLTFGICGERLAGKDTVGYQLEKQLTLIKIALADSIKQQYSKLLNLPLQDLYIQGETKEYHRLGLITLGMLRRSDHQDWWCREVHQLIQNNRNNKGAIITDIRFKNEILYFKENSDRFFLIEVKAETKEKIKRGWRPSFADTTATEQERHHFSNLIDYTIINNKTKQHFYNEIDKLIMKINLAQTTKMGVN